MFYAVAIIVFGTLGQFTSGFNIPLEDPLIHLEDPIDRLEDTLVRLEDAPLNVEDPSTDYNQFFESRIVGGTEASKNYAPHMAALVVGHIFKSLVCGGSIISSCHILTAAHCVTSFIQWEGDLMDSFHGRVGTNTWHGGIGVEFQSYQIHPDYDPWMIKSDVAVLEVKGRIPLSKKVAIIALNYDWVDGAVKSYVTGWGTDQLGGGVPELLQILYLSTITPQECQDKAEEVHTSGWWSPPIDHRVEICTFHSPGHGMCHGDSGSALVSVKDKKQCGIVSWGYPCAIGGPDVFVRIKGVKEFILAILKKGCPDHCT